MMDSVRKFIHTENVAETELFHRHLADEEYVSESVEFEVDMFYENGASNLLTFAQSHSLPTLEKAITNFFREFRAATHAFSTGIIFWYWPWHRRAENHKKMKQSGAYQNMDFGGHSISDLCVSPRFASLKEEAMESNVVDIKEFNATVVEKAQRYLKGRKCRAMRSAKERFHFGIPYESSL